MQRKNRVALALLVLLAALVGCVAAVGDPGPIATILISALAAFAGPWLIQPVKTFIDRILPNPVGKKLTSIYTYALSFGLGIAVFAATGGLPAILASPWTIFSAGSGVAGLAGLFFNLFKDRYALSRDTETVPVAAKVVKIK